MTRILHTRFYAGSAIRFEDSLVCERLNCWNEGGVRPPVEPHDPPMPVRKMQKKQPMRRHDGWRMSNSLMMLRAVHGMSQTELARRVGISRQTVSAIENRRHEPVLSLGMAITEVFGVAVEDIFELRRPEFNAYDQHKR